MIEPPTGTMKFLSVLEMITSTLPILEASTMSEEILEHYKP